MILAITIEHAVTKPMVRLGGTDLIAARWVSVVIRGKFYVSYSRMPNIQGSAPRSFSCSARAVSSVVRSTAKASVCRSMNAHPKLAIETAPQLAVCLANRPGAPARVCEALANAGINILRVEYTISRVVAHGKGLIILRPSGMEKRDVCSKSFREIVYLPGRLWADFNCRSVRRNPR